MPRGVLIKQLRKAGAFLAGELGAGQLGVNTVDKTLEFSPDGNEVRRILPAYEKVSFQSAGSRNIPFAEARTVAAPVIISDGSVSLSHQYRASGSATPVVATFPLSVAAGSVLIPVVSNMNAATYVALAYKLT